MHTKEVKDKTKQFTRGGQITFHNIRMLLQVNKTVWNIYLFFLIILVTGVVCVITPRDILLNAWYWCLAQLYPVFEALNFKINYFVINYHGHIYRISPKTYLTYSELVKTAKGIIPYIKYGIGIGFGLSLGVLCVLIKWLILQGKKQTTGKFLRGARLDTVKNVVKMLKKQHADSDITIDAMPIVAGSETKHFLVHGSTGSGKTQLISKFLDHLRERGDKVFLYDKGGVYTSTFYRKDTDKILNPFDVRCENWNLWHEARTASDFENMAESLIPMHGESDPFWVNAARTIFGSAAFTMQDDSDRSIKKLLKMLLTSELKDLHNYLANTEAASLASDKIEKTAISIRSVITTYLKSLRFMTGIEQTRKPSFCIRDWICNDINNRGGRSDKGKSGKDDSWLFLSSNAAQHASLKPLLSMWFSMATITLLALPEDRKRRIWFVCDELPSLHKLPQLPESVAEARKYGGCFILGMQSYAQLEKVYGRSAAKELFDLMNTSFFFRSPSPDMADLVSRALGSQEIEDVRENYSYGANSIRDGISIGGQRMLNQIVSPAEIMELEEMKCYLRLAGSYPITLLDLKLDKRPHISEGFISNDVRGDREIEDLIESYDSNVRNFRVRKAEKMSDNTDSKNKQSIASSANSETSSNSDNSGNDDSDRLTVNYAAIYDRENATDENEKIILSENDI